MGGIYERKVRMDSAQGALSLLQVSGDIRMVRLDKVNYTMVHMQSGKEGPGQRWADVAAAALRSS